MYSIVKKSFKKTKKVISYIRKKYIKNRILKILTKPTDKTQQKKIVKEFLNFVEIETFSFCNRRCWFCPNSKIDRHSENIVMPEETYLNLLKSLKEINYDGVITFSRYNEPLSQKELILKRIKQAKEYCPNAVLYTHTNGDYLTTKEYIFELIDAGLQRLAIQCYLDEDEVFDIENVIKPKMKIITDKLGLEYEESVCNKDVYTLQLILPNKYTSYSITIEALNFRKIGVSRGGSVEAIHEKQRTLPCLSPFYRVYIDYDGSVMPCCQVRHDVVTHTHMICGNINHEDIFDIFFSERFFTIRHALKEKQIIKFAPCDFCNGTLCDDISKHYGEIHYPLLRK